MLTKIDNYRMKSGAKSSRMNVNKRGSPRRTGFAERLREAMRDEGYIAKRGAKAGVDAKALKEAAKVQTVEIARRWVNGLVMPRTDKIDVIAAWLRVNTLWLRDGIGPKRGGTVQSLSPGEHEALDGLRSCSPENQKIILETIRALREKKG